MQLERQALPQPTHQDLTGTVSWFEGVKGFGFITPDDASIGDVFVHFSGIADARRGTYGELRQGDRVEFDLQPDAARAVAIDVRVLR